MPLRIVRHKKRSPHWYIRGTVRGQAVFETTGTDESGAAEAIRIRREAELLERSVFGGGAAVTFGEAVISYLEAGGEARFLGRADAKGAWNLLLGELGRTPLARIGQEEADRVARKLYPAAGPATRKRQCYIPLSAVLNHAARRKWCPRPVIAHPAQPPSRSTWMTPEKFAKLLPHCAPQLRRFLIVGAYTGARLSEILRLDWDEDVDLARRAILFRRTKNGEMRSVAIADPLLIELSAVPEAARHGRMFRWASKISVYVPLKNACRRAGVPYLPPHQIGRHTFATWLRIYAGLDLPGLKEVGGWKSIASVARYAHVAPGEAARAVNLLPAVQNPCSADPEPAKPKRLKRKTA